MNFKVVRDALIIGAMKSIPDLKRRPSELFLIGFISALPLFFTIVLGGKLSLGIVGSMVSMASYIGMAAAIQELAFDRYTKIREMIVAMPVHPVSYSMGVALAPLVLASPGLVFFIVVAVAMEFLPIFAVGWVVASLLLCWAATSSIGFIISTYVQKASVYTLNSLSNILSIGLVFLPPVYYSEELLGNFSWVSVIFPTSNTASLIRFYSGISQLTQDSVLIRWIVLIMTVIAAIIIVAFKAKWRED